jgi:hypothetical protein
MALLTDCYEVPFLPYLAGLIVEATIWIGGLLAIVWLLQARLEGWSLGIRVPLALLICAAWSVGLVLGVEAVIPIHCLVTG